MHLECMDEKHQIWACYLIIWPIVCTQLVWPCHGNTHDWETCTSRVYLDSTQAVVLTCPVGPGPTTLANRAGISQLATSEAEGEKGVKTCRGESMLPNWIKPIFPLLTKEPDYTGSAASQVIWSCTSLSKAKWVKPANPCKLLSYVRGEIHVCQPWEVALWGWVKAYWSPCFSEWPGSSHREWEY